MLQKLLVFLLLLLTSCSHPTKLSLAKMQLVGVWHENGESKNRINELIFRDDGTFSVTVTPFDVYKDYWGTYTIDPKKHKIHLKVEDGNNIPQDLNITTFKFKGYGKRELTLKGGYFGTLNSNFSKKEEYSFIKGY